MKPKTPQEKKALSLAKDTRDTYGQNDKASRKLVPLRKAQSNRKYRRKVSQILSEKGDPHVDSLAKSLRRDEWKKWPGQPLGDVIERQLTKRAEHAGNGKTARKAAAEFVKRLSIRTEQETDGRWIAEAVELNGVMRYGTTRKEAVTACKDLARIVFLERLGTVEEVNTSVDFVSYTSK